MQQGQSASVTRREKNIDNVMGLSAFLCFYLQRLKKKSTIRASKGVSVFSPSDISSSYPPPPRQHRPNQLNALSADGSYDTHLMSKFPRCSNVSRSQVNPTPERHVSECIFSVFFTQRQRQPQKKLPARAGKGGGGGVSRYRKTERLDIQSVAGENVYYSMSASIA